jgi:acetyl-CoA C-acetyltransferase
MTTQQAGKAYIIAAKRTALGRVGGLHRSRRLEQLAAPVIVELLSEAGLPAVNVDEIVVGNATAGGNPARTIALASGLPETVTATTVDQQDASGLVAILHAIRLVAQGDAEAVVAGGAESISTAPWRIARPRNVHQIPHFINPQPSADDEAASPVPVAATERLAVELGISRARQDAFAHCSFERALKARRARHFTDEIVPLRARSEEARDQSTVDHHFDEFAAELPFAENGGTVTPANTSRWHDGAAFVVVVSETQWHALGTPPALVLVASASLGVPPAAEARAPIEAIQKLYGRLNGFDRNRIGIVELSEASAAQAVALADTLGIDESRINPEGGAIARGHPFGAAGAVLVVRLFSQLVRNHGDGMPVHGIAAQGASGGLGVAALFAEAKKN